MQNENVNLNFQLEYVNVICKMQSVKCRMQNTKVQILISKYRCIRYCYCNIYAGYHHVKANVLTIPKMFKLLVFSSYCYCTDFDGQQLWIDSCKPSCVTHIVKTEAVFFHLVLSWIGHFMSK